MKKYEKFKPLLIPLVLTAIQGLSYLIVKPFQANIHTLGNGIDAHIPFISYFVIVYCSWYVMLFIVPYLLYKKDRTMLAKYVSSLLIGILICCVIFIIYPTTVLRPEINSNNIFDMIVKLIYLIDTPAINCMPSIHCLLSMLFILTIGVSKKFNLRDKLIIAIISILIMLSTLFIKEHALIDLITGDVLMTIVFLCVNYNKKLVNNTKKLLNI